MPLLTILFVTIAVGVVLWLINAFIPMAHNIKTIFNGIVIFVLIAWLLKAFGIFNSLMGLHT